MEKHIKITDRFIILPKDLIIPLGSTEEERDNTILKRYGDKGFLIMLYIAKHRTIFNKSYISLANCIQECGYKLPKKENATVKEFKDTLKKMINDKVIKTNMNKFKINDLVVCELEEDNKNFFKLEEYQYRWIMEYKGKEKKINLLKIFCIIKARIYVRNKNESIYSGIYEVAFPSYKDIQYYTKISESNIKKYLDILVDLKLIKYDNAGTIYNPITKETKECSNTYVIYKEGWEQELLGSIRLFKDKAKAKGLIIKKKKTNNSNNS